jgi:hypothetical protein
MNKILFTLATLFLMNIVIFSYHSFLYFSFMPPQDQFIMGEDYGVRQIVANYFNAYLALTLALVAAFLSLFYFNYKRIAYWLWLSLVGLYAVLLTLELLISNGPFVLVYSLPIMLCPLYQVICPIVNSNNHRSVTPKQV